MTVFIASLFLPYTASFNTSSQPNKTRTSSSEASSQSTQKSSPVSEPQKPTKKVSIDASAGLEKVYTVRHGSSKSLDLTIRTSGSSLPKTPGATTLTETIFMPQDASRNFNLTLPRKKQKNSASTSNLRSLLRADIQSPGWGTATELNQPKSQAKSLHTTKLLVDGKIESDTAELEYAGSQSHDPTAALSTENGKDHQFTIDNYTIQPTIIGNGGLFSAIDAVSAADKLDDKTWVGTLGMPTDALDDAVKQDIADRLANDYEALVVHVDDTDMDAHYEQYCKRKLWPSLHSYIPGNSKRNDHVSHTFFKNYIKVNQAFADCIIKSYKNGDIIWIHDYHLTLLPAMIRKQIPNAKIGFYMHSAFPGSSTVMMITAKTEVLGGLIGANVVGFQTEVYRHHFLQSCSRLLQVEATKKYLILEDGRYVHTHVSPMGVDVPTIDNCRNQPEVAEWIDVIQEKYPGQRIIVARDKLDTIRGIKEKLQAFDFMLDTYPELRDDVVLIQIATTATKDQDFINEVRDLAHRINDKYSSVAHQAIVFLAQDIDYSQYLALLSIADCLMVTPLREGMNLTTHEFVVCQDGKNSEQKHAPILLSTATGASTIFGEDAVLIHPRAYEKNGHILKSALEMDAEEREKRWTAMYQKVGLHDATRWYESCMKALDAAWKENSVRESISTPRLSLQNIQEDYNKSTRRLLLIDYEGTLANWGIPGDEIVSTPDKAIVVLNDLINDQHNLVYVTSQRKPDDLERDFRRVPGLGLVAENGAFIREAGDDGWIELFNSNHVQNWKNGLRPMINDCVNRVPGSILEELHSGFFFRYDQVDDHVTAGDVAGECISFINISCADHQVTAIRLEQGVYIMDSNANKACAAKEIFKMMSTTPDFLLVMGDSQEDDRAFSWANAMKGDGVEHIYTVIVGQRASEATTTLRGPAAVMSTLEKLAKQVN